jgi:GTP pyrophosphokinase
MQTRRSRMDGGGSGILIDGVDNLLTQLARCCKPVPPDAIAGFVTRGKGVSIHRAECRYFKSLAKKSPERVIPADWGQRSGAGSASTLYAVELVVDAQDRQGLLRDISEVLSREKINVTAARTLSRSGSARMAFTVELNTVPQLQRMLTLVREVPGVIDAWRG